MKVAARAAFRAFSEPLEGVVPHMYQDSIGKVTVAMGNLIDVDGSSMPWAAALMMPFLHRDGTPATGVEIRDEWLRIKNAPGLAEHGWKAAARVATLHLDTTGIELVVLRTVRDFVERLRVRFDGWDDWPADAQLAVLSQAWACGTAFKYPIMAAALRRKDFEAAARECTINPQRGTIIERNRRNRTLLMNAARVVEKGMDPETLYWPKDLGDATTEPELPAATPTDETVPREDAEGTWTKDPEGGG